MLRGSYARQRLLLLVSIRGKGKEQSPELREQIGAVTREFPASNVHYECMARGVVAAGFLENKDLRRKPARKVRPLRTACDEPLARWRPCLRVLPAILGCCTSCAAEFGHRITRQSNPVPVTSAGTEPARSAQTDGPSIQWQGLPVRKISFEGIYRWALDSAARPACAAGGKTAELRRRSRESSPALCVWSLRIDRSGWRARSGRRGPDLSRRARVALSEQYGWTARKAQRSIRNCSAPASLTPAPASPMPSLPMR